MTHTMWLDVLHQFILFLVQVSVVSVISLVHMFTPRLKQWFDHHTTLAERQILTTIAKEAAIFAEHAFVNLSGPEKLDEALRYSLSVLNRRGIQVNPHEIRAVIEQAVQSLNANRGQT